MPWACSSTNGLTGEADLLAETDPERATQRYKRADQIIEDLLHRDDTNPEHHSFHALVKERMADMRYYAGNVAESCEQYREALEIRRQARRLAPEDANLQRSLTIALQNVGWCLNWEGRSGEAVPLFEESIALQRRLLDDDPSNVVLTTNLMGGLGELGNVLRDQKNVAAAAAKYREALAVGASLRAQGISDPRLDEKTGQIEALLAEVD